MNILEYVVVVYLFIGWAVSMTGLIAFLCNGAVHDWCDTVVMAIFVFIAGALWGVWLPIIGGIVVWGQRRKLF
jgi:hypothetical protein